MENNDKLYYADAYCQTFTSTLEEAGVDQAGRPYVVLRQTVFYPTGGGQPCDLGTINGVRVVEVEEIDGQIRHFLERSLPESAAEVTGSIDWERRFDHMQQHTGQHILSAVFDDTFGAPTVGFHLGTERVTIDIATAELTEETARQAEQLANRIVFENRPITARFVTTEELSAMPLRKQPTVTENIRIVTIENIDHNPCGGTHPSHTGEVGPIKILTWQRNKGNVRVEFICGWRVLTEMGKNMQTLQTLSKQLLAPERELPAAVDRLQAEAEKMKKALQTAETRLLDTEAKELLQQARSVQDALLVTACFSQRPMPSLQKLAQRIAELSSQSVALLFAANEKTQLVFASGQAVHYPMNQLLQEVLPLIEGKGGGNPHMAQGGGIASIPVQQVMEHAANRLEQALNSKTTVTKE
ncbi:serine-tRNA(Ala) deacylase AlaX [Brevibacillus fulvus]|uniref:Alanine--tRNA ligase n=2 Tax=Brevibacillus fulvus TaxID=1125967 RepID=A0A939BR34_9BACL|nr:DHHA1 domain-containing protein [Brevibacillus fulvus]MBM7589053.1 alanyl-tRNA synthetase [Brevibacillus fulvus]